ncbi:unnamed protein product [Calicophoron daubneyi]|uniref:acid phosphatase n=1 Tax=Calicophoron daubneyi TaxID=300641 RepID=A0AAV2T2A1_CALDB
MCTWLLESPTSLFLILTTVVDLSFSLPREGVAVPKLGDLKLQHLHLLFRHGDRSPIVNAFNTSIPFEKLWPSGYGQLTKTGIVQEFQLGRWLRQKYGTFIPLSYNASEFHMRSTDVDRTLMSAQAVLAGVYENVTSPLKPYGVSWTPIPVHTVKQTNDVLLSVADCPRLNLLRNLQMQSEAARDYESKHQRLFDLLSQVSGRKIDRTNLWELHDMAVCMKANKMSLPEWCTKEVLDEMTEVESFYWTMKYAGTPEILRLEFGVFINALVTHINAIINCAVSPMFNRTTPLSVQHVLAYSAHDIQVSYLLSALGVFDGNLINYGSAVIIELFGPDPPAFPSDYYMRVLYKRGWTDTKGEYLPMPMCASELTEPGCRVDRVLQYLDPLAMGPDSFLRECTFSTQRSAGPSGIALHSVFTPYHSPVSVMCVVTLVLVGVCVVVAVAVYFTCRFCGSGRDVPYALLQTADP